MTKSCKGKTRRVDEETRRVGEFVRRKLKMRQIFFIIFNYLITVFLGCITFVVSSLTTMFIVVQIFKSSQEVGLEAFTYATIAYVVGLLAALFSLLPSYKLCMRMAERLRFRGWPLIHPRRLFALSLFLLILPIILLMLSGIVFGA